jgi:hypothetical protein
MVFDDLSPIYIRVHPCPSVVDESVSIRISFLDRSGIIPPMRTSLSIIVLLLFWCAATRADVVPLRKLDRAQQDERIAGDLKAVEIYRTGLLKTTAFALQQTNLFPQTKSALTDLPRREDKEILWQTWKSYLDYLLALDTIDHYHREFYRLSKGERERSFLAGYAAFLAKYRCGLEFIEAAKNNPLLDKILNDPVPELGLPAGTYAKIKFQYLNVATATDFAARRVLFETMSSATPESLRQKMDADTDFIWKMGRGKGETLTAANALTIVQNVGNTTWLPVQAGVAEWMGDTKVYRRGRSLISESQIQQLQPDLQPGDVLLVRHEWYLSNVGLPGFWPHAALYIGTPEERERFFADPEVTTWVRDQKISSGSLDELLKSRSPDAYARSLETPVKNHPVRVMEAISEGVSFNPLEHSADADSLVVLRPLLPKTEKAIALLRAFHYTGRPYDFNFDFATDSELVCSELVFKCYEPSQGHRGLHLPLVEMLGRPLLPPNEIVRQFDMQSADGTAQFQFVAFLDGYEREGKAKPATVGEFRQSWHRPKWHVLTQKAE